MDGSSGIITFVPAEKHCYATSEDVELGPLLLHKMSALLTKRSAGLASAIVVQIRSAIIEACSGFSSTVTFLQCHEDG